MLSSNIKKNDGGNVYIGSYKIYLAITNITITQFRILLKQVIIAEKILMLVIFSYITQNFTDNLEIRVFQEGSNKCIKYLFWRFYAVDDTYSSILFQKLDLI